MLIRITHFETSIIPTHFGNIIPFSNLKYFRYISILERGKSMECPPWGKVTLISIQEVVLQTSLMVLQVKICRKPRMQFSNNASLTTYPPFCFSKKKKKLNLKQLIMFF